jgi:predicted O-methyltransferase YrrM
MEHPGSRGTYEAIANWIAPDFFFSKTDVWHRMGFLGVFGDFVLSCTPGEVLEIGTGESSIYLAKVAKKYGRHIYHCDASPSKIDNPLTIPGYMEPEIATFFRCASDEMFKSDVMLRACLALSFIDGDHNYAQVEKDFINTLALTVENGYIILHDTYPPDESYIDENRCGTVYKLRQEIEKEPMLDCITLPRGCAMGVGFTIVRKKPLNRRYFNE